MAFRVKGEIAFASVLVLLAWVSISACNILMGAEVIAELDAQSRADMTAGDDRATGTRNAENTDHPDAAVQT